MPNIKSSIKRVRSSQAKAVANKSRKSELRTLTKKAILAKEQGLPNAEILARSVQAKIDRAAADGLLSKNTAARKKSRIARVQPTDV
ncbi:MAG: 30S ribosomal protein S20 [Clostridiaceae bacterium]|nr:30S ribosomal protein S20 [Clostridiaceae bacterium]